MINNSGRIDQIRKFEYPIHRRLPTMLMFGMSIVMYGLIIMPISLLSLVRLITDQVIFDRIGGPTDLGTLLAFVLVPAITSLGAYGVNLIYPAVHIKSDGFRISRLFYESPWFGWQDIHVIKKHRQSSRFQHITSITVEGLPRGFFSLIGVFVLSEGKEGFVVASTIENYIDLLKLFRNHRPDLFEGPGKEVVIE